MELLVSQQSLRFRILALFLDILLAGSVSIRRYLNDATNTKTSHLLTATRKQYLVAYSELTPAIVYT